ncbi:response regulator transcription factor [Niallia sp. XMNu-256]|uniref:response regulator n=1 Tax=Niallia sp. XMNu-256 TaxID=3082444 RepID=UPI0030CB1574
MITIVIAEDQEMLLGVIGSLLNLEEDMKVVGQASNGKEALELVHEFQPDVCLMDIEMPEMNGLDAAQALMTTECKVIILTTFPRKGYFERAIKAGVRGFLLKDSPSKELVYCIRKIMNGEKIYSPELIDDDSLDPLIHHKTAKHHKKGMRTVKNYFSIFIDKLKLRTG